LLSDAKTTISQLQPRSPLLGFVGAGGAGMLAGYDKYFAAAKNKLDSLLCFFLSR
jgi:hypothetical protein